MLQISNLRKVFNPSTVNEKVALDNVSLKIEDGEFVTVIGSNGSGKTTLLNMIAGVYEADLGTISLNGVDLTRMPEYKRAAHIGRVFQDPMKGTCGSMTVIENMAMGRRRGKRPGFGWGTGEDEPEFYKEALKKLDLSLEERINTKIGLLSGGQRQAITLLMATLKKPDLLLLDEHTAALDPKTAAKVLQLTKNLVEDSKITTLMITHNMKDALALGNRLIMMHEGRVILDVKDEEKSKLSVEDLLRKFEGLAEDKILLA